MNCRFSNSSLAARAKVMMRYFKAMFNNNDERIAVPSRLFDKDFGSKWHNLPPVLDEFFAYKRTDSDKEDDRASEPKEESDDD